MGIKELLKAIEGKKKEMKSFLDQDNMEGARNAKKELEKLQAKYDLLKELEEDDLENRDKTPAKTPVPGSEKKNAVREFAQAARNLFRNSMQEGAPADGGYTVPEDIQTKINEYRDAEFSLIDLVDVERVTTNKGSRTFKKKSQQTGFTKVGEGGKIPAGNTPQFERLDWEIEKYAGYFPVTNELLADSDANITQVLTQWIGGESRATRNNIILAVAKSGNAETVTGLDDIKKILNVTLGQAFKPTSKVVTNDDGLQWLDTLKDSDGNYILQPDPAEPMKMRICAGATIVPVKVVPNKTLASDTATAGKRGIPLIIGDLKEGIKFWDRNHTSIMSSNIAVAGTLNAFEEDLTLFRAIEREDCTIKDKDAFVYATLTLDDSTVQGS